MNFPLWVHPPPRFFYYNWQACIWLYSNLATPSPPFLHLVKQEGLSPGMFIRGIELDSPVQHLSTPGGPLGGSRSCANASVVAVLSPGISPGIFWLVRVLSSHMLAACSLLCTPGIVG